MKYRHAKGFGAYAKATGEPRHPVRASQVWTDAQGTYCGQCAHPVVEVRPK